MLNKIVQKILSEINKTNPLQEENKKNGEEFLWEDVTGEDSIDTDAFTPKPAEPKISTYKLPAPKVPLAPPEPPVPPTPPEPPKAPVVPKVKVELPEIIIPKEKVEDPVYTASLVNTYSGGKMKLQVQNADGTYSDWAGNEDGSNDYSEYDMIMGFFSGTMKIVNAETGEEVDLNKIRDMFNGTIKPEKPKTESSDPDLTASNLDAYTGGKMKLYIKQGSNYVEWAPNADGTNDFTEEEMIQMLFSGEAKMNYTETGEEVKLNTIKDLFNGTLKPENIKPDGVDVSKPADPVNPSKPESFTDIYNEMLEKVPSSTSTVEEKELALSYIQRILASDASQKLKDYWTDKAETIMEEIKGIQALNQPETTTKPTEPNKESETPTTPVTPPAPSGVRTQAELKTILSEFGKSIDNSNENTIMNLHKKTEITQTDEQYTQNQQIFTEEELLSNLDKLTGSSNPELKGIGDAIADVFKAMGIEIPDKGSKNPTNIYAFGFVTTVEFPDIVMNAIAAAIKGDEIDPLPNSDINALVTMKDMFNQKGLSVDDLMNLDKNGDGSIVEELKDLLSNPEFTDKLQFMVDREKNHRVNNGKIRSLAHDGTLTVGEIAAGFGSNDIAELFKTSDGRVDRALIIALGGSKSEDGNYTISSALLQKNLYRMDADRDGIVTKEEVEKFKQGELYRHTAYNTMMSEIEKADGGKYDGIVSLDGFTAAKNSTIVTPEQKDFASVINNIPDTRLKQYIFESLGDGKGSVNVSQFTNIIDADGDGIVTKQELQKYVDFVTQFYNVDKTVNYDRLLVKEEALKIEPFKSNPDIWYNFNLKNGCVRLQDVWNYVKTHK